MRLALPGLTMHLQADGPQDAQPLMLLHSLGTDHRVWQPQTEALAGRFRVLRPDLRGHGASDVPPGPYTIEGMARDVLAALDALGVNTLAVAGLSIGGMVAQSLAAQAPGRVTALVLVDTALAIPPAALWCERAATVRDAGVAAIADAVLARWLTPAADPAAAAALRALLLATAPEGYAGAAEAIAAADLTETTRRLRLPTLVLVGDQDEATPRASAEALRDAIPGARLVILPGAAHIPTVEQPAAVTDALLDFLNPPPSPSSEADHV
jgi:3-oxoadipate enol-lactonase